MSMVQARIVLASGFLLGGLLLLSLHLFATRLFDQEKEYNKVYQRYRQVHYLVYALLLIAAALIIFFISTD